MASPESHPPLVSLVLESKKALQDGEQLCSRASSLSSSSAQCAVDVLALDAKVKWLSAAVLEQLKLAAMVAKSIDQKRAQLHEQAKEWDRIRTQHTDALDAVLESLGAQVVPHDFHSTSADSSLFGSPNSDKGIFEKDTPDSLPPTHSPAATVRSSRLPDTDRTQWKTLRDFVDERAIEDALDIMESDRSALDDTLATTADYPETLYATISTIQQSLPEPTALLSIETVLSAQMNVSSDMARHLESLALHYDQMAEALRTSEAGEQFSQEDLQAMNRDTEELPIIITELEESCNSIENSYNQLVMAKNEAQNQLINERNTLDDLDELGEIMTQMLDRQQDVETHFNDNLGGLQEHLITTEELQRRYTLYQLAYNKLLLEMGRRKQYQQAAENIVRTMREQLTAMAEEERLLRAEFNAEQGPYMPDDLCLAIENMPTRWDVIPLREDEFEDSGSAWRESYREVIPEVDNDLIAEARERISIANAEVVMTGGSQSI